MSDRKSLTRNERILDVRGLKTYFFTEDGVVKAVDGVDFYVHRGEVVGLVGESGCGKSVTSFSIMRLVGMPGKIVEGEILFDERNILELPESEMMHIRARQADLFERAFLQRQRIRHPQCESKLNSRRSRSALRSVLMFHLMRQQCQVVRR